MKKINQMEIGLTNKLSHVGKSMRCTTLEEGRGVLAYSRTKHGIRMEVISGDGLDTYYFDVPEHAIAVMGLMVADQDEKL